MSTSEPTPRPKVTVEMMMESVLTLLREEYPQSRFTAQTHAAVVDKDDDGDGRLDDNEETGPGSKPGFFTIEMIRARDGKRKDILREQDFTPGDDVLALHKKAVANIPGGGWV